MEFYFHLFMMANKVMVSSSISLKSKDLPKTSLQMDSMTSIIFRSSQDSLTDGWFYNYSLNLSILWKFLKGLSVFTRILELRTLFLGEVWSCVMSFWIKTDLLVRCSLFEPSVSTSCLGCLRQRNWLRFRLISHT